MLEVGEVGRLHLRARAVVAVHLGHPEVDRRGPHRDAARLQRGDVEPRGLAEAEAAAQEARDVDADGGGEAGLGRAHRRGRLRALALAALPGHLGGQRRLRGGEAAHPLVERLQRAQELLVDDPLVDGVGRERPQDARRAALPARRPPRRDPGRCVPASAPRRGRDRRPGRPRRRPAPARSAPAAPPSPRPRRRGRERARRPPSPATPAARASSGAPRTARSCAAAWSRSGSAHSPSARVGVVSRADADGPVVDQPGVERRQEVARPAVVGGHDRHAEQRGLREGEAEALGAMQRTAGSRAAR